MNAEINKLMKMHKQQQKTIERFAEGLKLIDTIQETQDIKDSFNDYGMCKHCGWCCEYPESHIMHAMWGDGCKYIKAMYHVWIDEDGEIQYTCMKSLF
jgi:hypothetical protein